VLYGRLAAAVFLTAVVPLLALPPSNAHKNAHTRISKFCCFRRYNATGMSEPMSFRSGSWLRLIGRRPARARPFANFPEPETRSIPALNYKLLPVFSCAVNYFVLVVPAGRNSPRSNRIFRGFFNRKRERRKPVSIFSCNLFYFEML